MKKIIINADTNDGDYITSINTISEETLEKIIPVINAITNCKLSHNYPTDECVQDKSAEDLYGEINGFKEFNELLPYATYGMHTIESIELLNIVSSDILFKVTTKWGAEKIINE